MAETSADITIKRWRGGQHPSLGAITRLMQQEGLRPYMWMNLPNHRQAVRTHGYNKVVYVIDGLLEIIFPDRNQRILLRSGDRIDIPAGVRHGTIVGTGGVKCVEASLSRRRARR
jgi:hypothetical protein